MAVLAEWDLMPDWVADGLAEAPWESDVVPEIPDWLLEAPVSTLEPGCDCGRSCLPAPVVEEPVRWAVPGVWPEEPTGPVEPSPAVAAVQAAVAALEGADPGLLSGPRALADTKAMLQVGQRLRVQLLGRYQDIFDRRLYRQAGFRSVNAWVRSVAPDAVGKDVTLAKRLPDLPHVTQALHEGSVSLTAAGKVAGSMVKMRPHLDRPDGLIDGLPGEEVVAAVVDDSTDVIARDRCGLDPADPGQAAVLAELHERTVAIHDSGGSQHDRLEQACLLRAEQLQPRSLPAALEDVELAVVPSVLEDQHRRARDKRGLQLSRNDDDGTWQLEATLTAEAGERLFTVLGAEARRDPANPVDTAARAAAREAHAVQQGRDPWTDPQLPAWEQRAVREGLAAIPDHDELVPRSRSKRLHDAFDRLLERYLSSGLGGSHGKVPVQVTVTASTALIDGTPGARPARGASGQPIARALLRSWWCDSHITTLLLSRGWTPLGVVHSARTLTGTETKAARVQFDNRCAADGCCSGERDPLIPLLPHHVHDYATHRRTSLGETILLCHTAHQDLHLGKRTIRLRDGRPLNEDGWATT